MSSLKIIKWILILYKKTEGVYLEMTIVPIKLLFILSPVACNGSRTPLRHICSPEPCALLSLELDKPEESYSDNSDLEQISNPAPEKTPVLPHLLLYIIKVLHAEAKLSHS